MEASYYDSIMEQQRLEPEFFRVGFYGRKFPFFLRVSPSGGHGDPASRAPGQPAPPWPVCAHLSPSLPILLWEG